MHVKNRNLKTKPIIEINFFGSSTLVLFMHTDIEPCAKYAVHKPELKLFHYALVNVDVNDKKIYNDLLYVTTKGLRNAHKYNYVCYIIVDLSAIVSVPDI